MSDERERLGRVVAERRAEDDRIAEAGNRARALMVACPDCGAVVGAFCRDSSTGEKNVIHMRRFENLAKPDVMDRVAAALEAMVKRAKQLDEEHRCRLEGQRLSVTELMECHYCKAVSVRMLVRGITYFGCERCIGEALKVAP